MTDLSLVPAGAGAGKTWHIQKTLAQWVAEGAVAPGRILAVTYTEPGAAEMRNRIRGELMETGRIQDALEIDRAYVGTIHALGQRLLTEHAFAAGRSPEGRLLSEPERDLLIRLEMDRAEALMPVMADLGRFGYAWTPGSANSAEDKFRADVLKAVDLVRSLGDRGQSPDILAPALQALDDGYGDCAADGAALETALRGAVTALLTAFPDNIGSLFAEKKTVREAFAKDHKNLRLAARPGTLETDWSCWQKLRKLRLSNSRSKTPDGYDTLAEAVIEAADHLPRHPGPLADAKLHLSSLITGAQQVLEAYQAAKRRAGLIDFADMIAEAEALLRTRPEILNAVLGEIDCVVIDEFQDTNPVQFALLWQLARGAKRALIVGDTKQSIMGFQGADPRLSEALTEAHPDRVTPLGRNWRSEERIMEFVNALGPVLFEHYDPLEPTRAAGTEPALEVILKPKTKSDTTGEAIANRIAELLEAETPIFDKHMKVMRPARPGDIAVLTYSHSKAAKAAAALQAHGLPVRLQQDGWLGAPAMQVARAALTLAADPQDSHAALTWLTLGPARVPIEDALRMAVDGVLETHAALAPLAALAPDATNVAESVAEVLRITGLRHWAAGLADPAQALADLARLEAEAQEFDAAPPELRAAAGFHGAGLLVFLGWIAHQTARDWDRQPAPDGWTASAIEVVTWHASKGREWPITVVAGFEQTLAERPPALRAEFDGFDNLAHVLDTAGIGFLPGFAAPESQQPFAEARRADEERNAARKLYVALTRARDRLVLLMPHPPRTVPDAPKTLADLLRARAGFTMADGALHVAGTAFNALVRDGVPDVPVPCADAPETALRLGLPATAMTTARSPWRRSPSTLVATAPAAPLPLETLRLAEGVAETRTISATDRGTAWHLAFRVLAQRPDLASRLAATTALPDRAIAQIGAQAVALTRWLEDEGYDTLHFELPLQEMQADGSETNAILDCLAIGPRGLLILDHKSGSCPDPATRFESYRAQLDAYAAMVRRHWPDTPLHGIAIHWMSEGTLSVMRTAARVTA